MRIALRYDNTTDQQDRSLITERRSLLYLNKETITSKITHQDRMEIIDNQIEMEGKEIKGKVKVKGREHLIDLTIIEMIGDL